MGIIFLYSLLRASKFLCVLLSVGCVLTSTGFSESEGLGFRTQGSRVIVPLK